MSTAESQIDVRPYLPQQPSERRAWAIAGVLALVGLAVLVAVLTGAVGRTRTPEPPPVPVSFATPAPAAGKSAPALAAAGGGAIVARPGASQQAAERRRLEGSPETHISRRWMEGFYPIYETAQRTFGVNWLLLASIHEQESAFSTAPGIYSGLNFAHCCGGPMQFNVTNGGHGVPSTWDLVSDSYRYGPRPAAYDHMTSAHPSIYDDFDALMGAAHLLSADGAGDQLDGAAWAAAYDYYGHDQTGVLYADQVLARAIGWSQRGFCINCGVPPRLLAAVHAAYGVPVAATLEAEAWAAAGPVRKAVPHRRNAPAAHSPQKG